jgi:hypothetical protein
MAQEFVTKHATIIGARERNMKNSNGEYTPKVILLLDKGKDVFAPLATVQNTLDKMLAKSDLRKLVGSTLYYIASNVKKGDEFAFTEGGELADNPAMNDMEITTLKAVVPTDRLEDILDNCANYVQAERKDDESDDQPDEPTTEDLLAELAEITNVTNARAFVQDNAIFDEYAEDFKDFTTAPEYVTAIKGILTNMPF